MKADILLCAAVDTDAGETDYLGARDVKLAVRERFGNAYRGEIQVCDHWVTLLFRRTL